MDEQLEAAAVNEADVKYRVFRKTWGTEYTAAGELRFRIWAPGTATLALRLADETALRLSERRKR